MKAIEFLKTARKALGYTQKELAHKTGLELYHIKSYENSQARVPGDLILQIQHMLKSKRIKIHSEKDLVS